MRNTVMRNTVMPAMTNTATVAAANCRPGTQRQKRKI